MLHVYFKDGSVETHKVSLDTWIEKEEMCIWLIYSADQIEKIKYHYYVITKDLMV
tara:strand:- start:1582 stop:1746 length:165 start_codon:yes stop_codon:yes gene_type:complete